MTESWQVVNQSSLNLDGWLEFNRYKWGVQPKRVRLSKEGKELPAIEAVLYLDKEGRIVQPPLNPYLPVVFYPTPTNKETRLYNHWMSSSNLLAEEFLRYRVKGSVVFSPEVLDIRQWQWQGFLSDVRYTFYLDLPFSIEQVAPSVRNRINKANKTNFSCEIATKDTFSEVIECLLETEVRQKFNYRLNVRDLEMALELIGKESFRVYVARDSSDEVASSEIVISVPGLRAIHWIAGARRKFLSSGASQLLIWYILTDLWQHGATGSDFVGANLPTTSAGKADWGGKLMPYYLVRPLDLRTLGRLGLTILQRTRGLK